MPIDWKATMDDSAVTRAFRNIETGAGRTVRSVSSAFATLSSAAITAGIIGAGKAVIDLASNIADSAEAVGLSTDAYQELSGVFSQGGVNAEKFTRAMGILHQSIQEAIDGNEKTRTSFDSLGVSWEELSTMGTEEILNEIAEGLQNSSNWTESFAAATDILGKGQAKLIAQLRGGSEALDQQRKAIVTLNETAVRAFDATGDAAERVTKGALSRFGNALALAQAFAETLFEDAMGVDPGFDSRIAANRANMPAPAPAPIPEDPRIAKQREEDEKSNAEMWKEYNRLEAEAAAQAEKHADAQRKALERQADMQRAFQIEGLEGEAKQIALAEEKLHLEDKMFVVREEEKAQLIEKISLIEQQIAREKRLTQEQERATRIRRIQRDLEAHESGRDDAQGRALAFGLSGPDARRESVREQRRQAREQARQERIRERGGTDARFGAQKIEKEIKLHDESIKALKDALAAELDRRLPTQ